MGNLKEKATLEDEQAQATQAHTRKPPQEERLVNQFFFFPNYLYFIQLLVC